MPEYLMNGRELEMKTTSGSSGSSTKKHRPAVKSLWQRGLSAISLISHESTSSQLTKSSGSNSHHHHKQEGVEDVGGENDDKHHLYHHHNHQSLVKNKVISPRGRSGTLTLEAVHAIKEVSPLQAWEKQLVIDNARHRRKEGSRVTNFHETSDGMMMMMMMMMVMMMMVMMMMMIVIMMMMMIVMVMVMMMIVMMMIMIVIMMMLYSILAPVLFDRIPFVLFHLPSHEDHHTMHIA